MVHDIKKVIADVLNTIFPEKTIYDESIPQNFEEGSFLINIGNQEYTKQIGDAFISKVLIDIAYFPISSEAKKEECLNIQQELLRAFAIENKYRIAELASITVDDILHITFQITYREMKSTENVVMQQKEVNTSI